MTKEDPAFVSIGCPVVPADLAASQWSQNEPAFVHPDHTVAVEAKSSPSLSCSVPQLVRFAERGDELAVARLLALGEDPNRKDDLGLTALHGASKKGHSKIVSLLLAAGAETDARALAWKGEAPIHYACKYGHADVVEILLSNRANPTITSQDGRTPLQYAQEKKHAAVEEILRRAALWGPPLAQVARVAVF